MARSAEQRVVNRLRPALRDTDYRRYPNVRWIAKPDANSPARDGETDLVIVHPERGLLTLEIKGGRIRRDGQNRWWSGEHPSSAHPSRRPKTAATPWPTS